MATTTTHIGLDKPAKSDQNWHTPVNGNFDKISSLFSNTTSKSVAGGSTVTLTTTEAHVVLIILTGVLTADIDVVLPNSGYYRIQNDATGLFNITVKNAAYSSDTGTVVQKGITSMLLCQDAAATAEVGLRARHMGGLVAGATPTVTFLSAGLTFSKIATGIYKFTFDKTRTNTFYDVVPVVTGSVPRANYIIAPVLSADSFTLYARDTATETVDTDVTFRFTLLEWIGA